MTLGMRHRNFDAGRGWSVTTLRLLALVLVLLIAAPDLGLAADFAHHGKAPAGTELSVVAPADGSATDTSDPGVTCHVHCSCHQAITADAAPATAPAAAAQPNRSRSVGALASTWPDRLSRPPRA